MKRASKRIIIETYRHIGKLILTNNPPLLNHGGLEEKKRIFFKIKRIIQQIRSLSNPKFYINSSQINKVRRKSGFGFAFRRKPCFQFADTFLIVPRGGSGAKPQMHPTAKGTIYFFWRRTSRYPFFCKKKNEKKAFFVFIQATHFNIVIL